MYTIESDDAEFVIAPSTAEQKCSPEGHQDGVAAYGMTSLKATGIRVGLLINFGVKKCGFKRMVF